MSLLNVWHDSKGVTLGVDSLGAGAAQPVTISKALYLPGHRAAVASRGAHVVFAMLAASLVLDVSGSFDALRGLLPEQLERAWRAHSAMLAADGAREHAATDAQAGQDVVLAGWSPSARRFVSVVFTIRGAGPCEWFELGDDGDAEFFCASWGDDSGDLPDCPTDDHRLACMREQVASDRRRDSSSQRCGGELWLLKMTAGGAAMSSASV